MNNNAPEEFIPENLSDPKQRALVEFNRHHAEARAQERKPKRASNSGGVFLVCVGAAILFWVFAVKPGQDSMDNLEAIVVKNRVAVTDQQIRHRELLGTIFGGGALFTGALLMSRRSRAD